MMKRMTSQSKSLLVTITSEPEEKKVDPPTEDTSILVANETVVREEQGVTHFLIAADRFGNVIAYDPVLNSDVIPLLSTGLLIQALTACDDFLFIASYDEKTQKSFVDQYPIFVNTTLSNKPDFKIFRN